MNYPNKILLIQLFSNGDCLYATTVARQIKQDYPGCHITWAIAEYCRNIVAENPFVDETMVIKEINHRNWQQYWKGFQQKIKKWTLDNEYDEVVFTQIIGSNFANYDYCIRSSVFRGYKRPVMVPVQPVLQLTVQEIKRVEDFAFEHRLSSYKEVILIEFAPLSGQAKFSLDSALRIAQQITAVGNVVVIFSSNTKLEINTPSIIDGSKLSLREIAHLSHYCTLLVGCSSGTTWVTTSNAGKQLPMIQILDPNAYWFNSVVNDHRRFGLSTDHIIEIDDRDEKKIHDCVQMLIEKGFSVAKASHHQEWKMQFRITRGIISYFLGKGDFKSAIKHIRINIVLFGYKRALLKSIFLGMVTFPVINFINRRKNKLNEPG